MNVLMENISNEWHGCEVNTDYRTGIRIIQVLEDKDLLQEEQWQLILLLLFQNEDGSVRRHPDWQEFPELLTWLIAGWNHDNTPQEKKKQRLIDYDVDQWRIYADFIHVYGIDLANVKMHFWTFQGLLWAMPRQHSSFLQVIEIRSKEPRKGASREERDAIARAKEIYSLAQPAEEKAYTQDEIDRIDAFDRMMQGQK